VVTKLVSVTSIVRESTFSVSIRDAYRRSH
jgi:hypothetical protein